MRNQVFPILILLIVSPTNGQELSAEEMKLLREEVRAPLPTHEEMQADHAEEIQEYRDQMLSGCVDKLDDVKYCSCLTSDLTPLWKDFNGFARSLLQADAVRANWDTTSKAIRGQHNMAMVMRKSCVDPEPVDDDTYYYAQMMRITLGGRPVSGRYKSIALERFAQAIESRTFLWGSSVDTTCDVTIRHLPSGRITGIEKLSCDKEIDEHILRRLNFEVRRSSKLPDMGLQETTNQTTTVSIDIRSD